MLIARVRQVGRKQRRSRWWSRAEQSQLRASRSPADDVCCLAGAFAWELGLGRQTHRHADRRARHFKRRRRRHSGPLSLDLSLFLPLFLPSHTRLMPSSLHVLAAVLVAVRESHENRFVRKVQIRTRNNAAANRDGWTPDGRRGRGRGGKGVEGPFANENNLYLPKWRPQRGRRYKDTMAPSFAAITHITTYEGQRGTDAGMIYLVERKKDR